MVVKKKKKFRKMDKFEREFAEVKRIERDNRGDDRDMISLEGNNVAGDTKILMGDSITTTKEITKAELDKTADHLRGLYPNLKIVNAIDLSNNVIIAAAMIGSSGEDAVVSQDIESLEEITGKIGVLSTHQWISNGSYSVIKNCMKELLCGDNAKYNAIDIDKLNSFIHKEYSLKRLSTEYYINTLGALNYILDALIQYEEKDLEATDEDMDLIEEFVEVILDTSNGYLELSNHIHDREEDSEKLNNVLETLRGMGLTDGNIKIGDRCKELEDVLGRLHSLLSLYYPIERGARLSNLLLSIRDTLNTDGTVSVVQLCGLGYQLSKAPVVFSIYDLSVLNSIINEAVFSKSTNELSKPAIDRYHEDILGKMHIATSPLTAYLSSTTRGARTHTVDIIRNNVFDSIESEELKNAIENLFMFNKDGIVTSVATLSVNDNLYDFIKERLLNMGIDLPKATRRGPRGKRMSNSRLIDTMDLVNIINGIATTDNIEKLEKGTKLIKFIDNIIVNVRSISNGGVQYPSAVKNFLETLPKEIKTIKLNSEFINELLSVWDDINGGDIDDDSDSDIIAVSEVISPVMDWVYNNNKHEIPVTLIRDIMAKEKSFDDEDITDSCEFFDKLMGCVINTIREHRR